MFWKRPQKNRNQKHRRLRAEALESRELLAGDVAVSLSALGDLTITGDVEANEIAISQLDGAFEIRGINDTTITFEDTTGEAAIILDSQVTGSVGIKLDGGDDIANIQNYFSGDLNISTGPGSDEVSIVYSNVDGDLDFSGGTENDRIELYYTSVQGKTNLITGAGDDNVQISGSQLTGNVGITTGADSDDVTVYSSYLQESNLTISLGSGDDSAYTGYSQAKNLTVFGGAGDDNFNLYEFSSDNITFSLGSGNDSVYLGEVDIDTDLSINAGFAQGLDNLQLQRRVSLLTQ